MIGGLHAGEKNGYFIMMDMDYFKEINDNYGHPEGDRVLKSTAAALKEIFRRDGVIGRVGGDEFAVLIYMPISRDRLETNLTAFLNRIHKIEVNESRLSCSMGAVAAAADKTIDELYREADRLLYIAKKQGRDGYVVEEAEADPRPLVNV